MSIEPGGGEGAKEQLSGAGGNGGACRTENPLDALLDELQSLGGSGGNAPGGTPGGPSGGGGTLRRLHSYPCESSSTAAGGRLPPAPPPRTSSKSPGGSDDKSGSTTPSAAPPDPAARQAALEAKHQELLRKQRALQEQYTRLQSLSRPAPPPDLLQLKKTGSESNLLGKMGLALAPTGSLSQLSTAASNAPAQPTSTKIYETDIL
ncbi:hypothetical protein GE061_007693 [Apolygus lucorum]|uniref:Uncharacterized protein n=1 Tax=Apolygus lucorum TaxID=248454 RepID=A0A8S9WL96_APOLU|nr:hypothetical protein GE061_007693 [Apolygus lucorum]